MTGKFDPRKLLTSGLVVAGVTLLWLSRLNLQRATGHLLAAAPAGRRHVAALRALTTIAMDRSAREDGLRDQPLQSDAQHRRSIGIARPARCSPAQPVDDRDVVANVTPYDPPRSRCSTSSARRHGAGADAVTAGNRAYAALFAWCSGRRPWCRSSASFSMGIVFFALIPLVLLMKRRKRADRRLRIDQCHEPQCCTVQPSVPIAGRAAEHVD